MALLAAPREAVLIKQTRILQTDTSAGLVEGDVVRIFGVFWDKLLHVRLVLQLLHVGMSARQHLRPRGKGNDNVNNDANHKQQESKSTRRQTSKRCMRFRRTLKLNKIERIDNIQCCSWLPLPLVNLEYTKALNEQAD